MQLNPSLKFFLRSLVWAALGFMGLSSSATAAERYVFIEQPKDGYEAIQFNRHVRFDNLLVRNDYTFEAGTVLLQDRILTKTGQALFCGPTSVGDGPLRTWCFAVTRNSFSMPEYGTEAAEAPSGSFKLIRLRFD